MIDQHLKLNDNHIFLGRKIRKPMLIGSKKKQVWFQIKGDSRTLICKEWRQDTFVTLKLYSMGDHYDIFMIGGSNSEDHISNMKAELFQPKFHQKVTKV